MEFFTRPNSWIIENQLGKKVGVIYILIMHFSIKQKSIIWPSWLYTAYYMTCLFGLNNMMINIPFDIFCFKIFYVHNIQWKYTYFLDTFSLLFSKIVGTRLQIYVWLNVSMYWTNVGILCFTAYYKIKSFFTFKGILRVYLTKQNYMSST